jgi:hypothetical protein
MHQQLGHLGPRDNHEPARCDIETVGITYGYRNQTWFGGEIPI